MQYLGLDLSCMQKKKKRYLKDFDTKFVYVSTAYGDCQFIFDQEILCVTP
jgi:hypothetical protein